MRSDLIAAGMVHHWLVEQAPDRLGSWGFEPPDDLQAFVGRILAGFPGLDAQFAGQSATAAIAMDWWKLRRVALFGGGLPTPLSPAPSQVLYYTDVNQAVVEEAAAAGYRARRIDVRQPADLATLTDATAAIMTGLIHFFDDAAANQIFITMADAGFTTLVFNSMNENVDDALIQSWGRLGLTLYRRTAQEIESLLPLTWQLRAALPAREFFGHHRHLARQLSRAPNINHIYMAVRG